MDEKVREQEPAGNGRAALVRALNVGYAARKNGKTVAENPYPAGGLSYAWMRGFQQAG